MKFHPSLSKLPGGKIEFHLSSRSINWDMVFCINILMFQKSHDLQVWRAEFGGYGALLWTKEETQTSTANYPVFLRGIHGLANKSLFRKIQDKLFHCPSVFTKFNKKREKKNQGR